MARVWYGGIITDMKGSIGGTTFQANAAAKIAKLRSTRRKLNTALQSECISIFQQVGLGWQSLSQHSKDLWNAFATAHPKENKWGETKNMTGFNWYNSINTNLYLCGESLLVEPPVWETPLPIPEYDGNFVPTDFFLNFLEKFEHPDHYLLVFTSPLLRTVSTANRKVLRLTIFVDPGTTEYIYLENEYQETHGIPIPIPGDPVGKSIFVTIMSIHKTKGLASVYYPMSIVYEPS